MSLLSVQNLRVCYGDTCIVDGVSFDVAPGRWLMVVGPNGAGKSTVINAIAQGAPYTGSVRFEGRDITALKPAHRARKIGVMAQKNNPAYSFTVGEIVRLGRYAHSPGIFSAPRPEEEQKVREALEITGMLPFEHQSVLTLSGGEIQRAFLAQIFAQDPKLLILDEPTNHLDLVYQKQVFELIGRWAARPGRAVMSVVHDLSLARGYGTDAMLMHRGKVVGLGPARQVLNRENLQNVYEMDVVDWMRQLLLQWGDEDGFQADE